MVSTSQLLKISSSLLQFRFVDCVNSQFIANYFIFYLQTKLHDTICKRRRIATIATHDLSRIVPPLTFDCGSADSITLTPLGWSKTSTVQEFLDYLEDNKPDKKAQAKKKQKAIDTSAALLSK